MESLPQAASAEHLTLALRRSGVLGGGRVVEVAVDSARNTILSRIIRLRLSYEGAADAAPASLILKTGHPDRAGPGWNAGRHEVAFYAEFAAVKATALVPRCHEAHWDAGDNSWHLLLEDLTDSHFITTTWPLPPSFEHCQAIIRARARFHAAWWDDPRLVTTLGTWLDAGALDDERARLASPRVSATGCRRRGTISTSDTSAQCRVLPRATSRVATSRSFMATRTSGTA